MKNTKKILVGAAMACALFLTGCVSQVPAPAGSAAPAVYAVSPGLTNAAAKIQAAVDVLSPIVAASVPGAAPAVAAASSLVTPALSLLVLISGALAGIKTRQAASAAAEAQTQTDAAAALAATIPVASHPSALVNAAANGSTAAVAVHLANSLSPV